MKDSSPKGLGVGTVSDPSELRLRDALINDLDAGFADLMRQHSGIMYAVARGLVLNLTEAEDLVSESLLRAYRALAGYSCDRIAALSLRPWLLTILRNTARNAARDASRRPAGPPRHDPTEGCLFPGTVPPVDPVGEAEHREVQRSLVELLAHLSEAQRTAVVLRHALDMSISEIAQILKVKDGTAKSHISRGLQQLRTLIIETASTGSVLCHVSDDAVSSTCGDRGVEMGRLLTLERRRQ